MRWTPNTFGDHSVEHREPSHQAATEEAQWSSSLKV
jgi:hypothetical protein